MIVVEGGAQVWRRRRTRRKVRGGSFHDFLWIVPRATKLKFVVCRAASNTMPEELHNARLIRTQHQHRPRHQECCKQRHQLCGRGWRERQR